MGYLPANITVNQGALQQGVPDIFLRSDSQEGKRSLKKCCALLLVTNLMVSLVSHYNLVLTLVGHSVAPELG
jgi:hypothetical protein